MRTAQFKNWSAWDAVSGVLLSDDTIAKLRAFASWDDVINWLYLNDHKDAARAINKQVKA
jgi:hypothetical protein